MNTEKKRTVFSNQIHRLEYFGPTIQQSYFKLKHDQKTIALPAQKDIGPDNEHKFSSKT